MVSVTTISSVIERGEKNNSGFVDSSQLINQHSTRILTKAGCIHVLGGGVLEEAVIVGVGHFFC